MSERAIVTVGGVSFGDYANRPSESSGAFQPGSSAAVDAPRWRLARSSSEYTCKLSTSQNFPEISQNFRNAQAFPSLTEQAGSAVVSWLSGREFLPRKEHALKPGAPCPSFAG